MPSHHPGCHYNHRRYNSPTQVIVVMTLPSHIVAGKPRSRYNPPHPGHRRYNPPTQVIVVITLPTWMMCLMLIFLITFNGH